MVGHPTRDMIISLPTGTAVGHDHIAEVARIIRLVVEQGPYLSLLMQQAMIPSDSMPIEVES